VRVHPAYPTAEARVRALNRFYDATRRGTDVDDDRGREPFVILFVRLHASELHGECHGGASARHMASCPKTNAFKAAIRAQQHHKTHEQALVVHATDSTLETRANLGTLEISYEQADAQARAQVDSPAGAQVRRVAEFANETNLLAALDAANLKWTRISNQISNRLSNERMTRRTEDMISVAHNRGEIALAVGSDCLSLAYAVDPLVGVPPPAMWGEVVNASDRELLRVLSVGGEERQLRAHCERSAHREIARHARVKGGKG